VEYRARETCGAVEQRTRSSVSRNLVDNSYDILKYFYMNNLFRNEIGSVSLLLWVSLCGWTIAVR
jgi:hypothetical protein